MTITKKGIKTTEFWTILVTILAPVVGKLAGIDIPVESVVALIAWVAARSAQKYFGVIDQKTGKAAWQTSEFWVTIIFAALKTAMPDLPEDALAAVLVAVGARTAVKVQDYKQTIPEETDGTTSTQ